MSEVKIEPFLKSSQDNGRKKNKPESLEKSKSQNTPFEKYLELMKFKHQEKKGRSPLKIRELIKQLEKLCCTEETHLRNALRYTKKLMSKQNG
jgi:hypothetical protein